MTRMDFLTHQSILLWIAASFLCLGVGTFLTVADWRKHARRSSWSLVRVSASGQLCRACGHTAADPGAQWCWYCGQRLQTRAGLPPASSAPQTETRLVDLRIIDAEIRRTQASARRRR